MKDDRVCAGEGGEELCEELEAERSCLSACEDR